jgi:hypothetical protein
MGVLAARREGQDSVTFDIECPDEYRELPGQAHTSWVAGVMSEICGQVPTILGTVAYSGTVTTRFQAPVPVGARLLARAQLMGRERRKLFVEATLTSAQTGAELVKASAIDIAISIENLQERGLADGPSGPRG